MPRPPEMITRAAVSSGRSLLVSSRPTSVERPVSGPAATVSTGAAPPVAATASNPVERTVTTLIGSFDCTVASALPA